MSRRTSILPRHIMGALLIAFIGACKGDRPQTAEDSSLLQDLAMAEGPGPALEDTALRSVKAPSPQPRPTKAAPRPRTTTAPTPVTTTPTPAPAAPSRKAHVGAGAVLALTTGSRVCTTNRPGDKFIATLSSEVVGNDGFRFPAGSKAVVEVLGVTPSANGESATINFRVRAISVDGVTYPITGDVTTATPLERTAQEGSGSDKKKVIGGAIAGAVLGQVLGKDTKSTVIGAAAGAAAGTVAARAATTYAGCLPAQSALRVTLTEPVYAT